MNIKALRRMRKRYRPEHPWKRLFKTVGKISLTVGLLGAVGFGSFVVVQHYRKEQIGVEAVEYMYNFYNYRELREINMPELQKITTSSVYNDVSFDNLSTALINYLQFQDKPVQVKIIKVTDDYVKYSLISDSVSSSKTFIMFYDTNWLGQINYLSQAEYFNFEENSYS